jgi:pimeloyl-ACP methyl ester carboxylesterase
MSESEEFGLHEGLDLIKGRVVRLQLPQGGDRFKVPHIGWNALYPPAADRVNGCWDRTPLGTLMRGAMRVLGSRVEEARYMLAVTSPLTYQPLLPRDRLMIIGGVGDRLAPPKHGKLLWEHWGRPRLYWFPGNHIIHFDRGRYLREIARFLRHTGFSQGVFSRPRRSVPPPAFANEPG